MVERFPQKRLMVTGAGSGLGLAMARHFAAEGWRVAVTDLDADRASAALAEVRSAGGQGFAAACDVRSETQLRDVSERLLNEWSGVDVVINNAGVATVGKVGEAPLEDWDWVLDINLMGVVRGCHVFAPLLARQGSGHIVNIASLAGIVQAPAMASYNVSKIGVIGLSETLRGELRPHGVGVSVVCPSFVRTRLTETLRTPDPRLRSLAEKLVNEADSTAGQVAVKVYRGVMKKTFLILPQADVRWLYRLKRLSPGLFYRLLDRQAGIFLGQGGRGEKPE